MRKPSFGVTAFAVVTLSLIGAFRVLYEPLLPPSPTEYLVTIPSFEPLPAPIVEIQWKQSVEEGVTDAKKRKLGLLLFFIDPANIYAKQLELKVFRDPEMARFVNRNFVPVKVNLNQYPEWSQSLLPLQRIRRYFDPGAELVVTNQDGTLINHFVVDNPFQFFGPQIVLPFLIQSKGLINQNPSVMESDPKLPEQQSADIQDLVNADIEPVPAFSEFGEKLENSLKVTGDGPLRLGSTKAPSLGWRLLAKLGHVKSSASSIREIALTPLYDVIDGGFFREARVSSNLTLIDTAKSSSQNALSAQVIAQIGCASQSRELKQLAIDIGNEVITDFLDGDSLSTSRLNDQLFDSRSKRSSLTKRQIDLLLSPQDSKILMSFVTKSQSPDQDIAALLTLSALTNPEFIRVRQILREKLQSSPGLSEPDHIAVEGYLAARLFELYRYTDNVRFFNKAKQISEQVYSALGSNSVAKIYGNRQLGLGWLGSYLAVADCGLAEYAATGNIYPLRSGETALKLALSKFKDSQTGLLDNVAASATQNFALNAATPNLADYGRESLNAQAIRLAYSYSVTSESEASRGEFLSFAQGILARLNSVMRKANPLASGYFDAAFDVIENSAVMVTGPNRVAIGNKLAKILPFSVIFPMSVVNGPAEDHLYIRHGENLDGPYTVDEIQKKMTESKRSYSE